MARKKSMLHSHSATGSAILQWRCGFDYFVLRRPQNAIAQTYQLSRPTVVRYLQAARKWFSLSPDFAAAPNLTGELEQQLQHQLGLRRVVVAPVWAEDYGLTTRLLGRSAQFLFNELARPPAGRPLTIGVAGGETMLALALALRPFDDPFSVRLYPIVVGPHPDTELSAGSIAGLMAWQLRGPRAAPVKARPLVRFRRVSIRSENNREPTSEPAAEAMIQLNAKALQEARQVDMVFVGIGASRLGTTFARMVDMAGPELSQSHRRFDVATLERLGLVAEIASQLLPPSRRQWPSGAVWRAAERAWELAREYNATVTGLSLCDLALLASSSKKDVVAVAGGAEQKLDAIWHALMCLDESGQPFRLFNSLVTDARTAEALLKRLQLINGGSPVGITSGEGRLTPTAILRTDAGT